MCLRSHMIAVLLIGTSSLSGVRSAGAEGPELVSVRKIWDEAGHNAFTDLIRWHDKWYCIFRESQAHVGGDGKLRILESVDGESWHATALIAEEGIDLRDPKLSVTPDDRLMIVVGGSVYRGGTKLLGRQPRVVFSRDASTWTAPQQVLAEGDWLWRVTWHDGRAYGVSYSTVPQAAKDAKDAGKSNPTGQADWTLKLVEAEDGVNYKQITPLEVLGRANETTLRFLPERRMVAMVRREADDAAGWIGVSAPPYREWKWHVTRERFGGPNFLVLPSGQMWAVSRGYLPDKKHTTVLARMDIDAYTPMFTLPSGGDTSYAGLVWHEDLLWVSYYSSHEGKSAIYLAKFKLPK